MRDNRPPPAMKTEGRQAPHPKRADRGIPPLVWIVLALVLVAVVVGFLQYGGTHETPQGGEAPMADDAPAYLPPAPATGAAPPTPGAVINEGEPAQP